MKYSVVKKQVQRGHILFTLERSQFWGLRKTQTQVITEKANYTNHDPYTVIRLWPSFMVLPYTDFRVKFVNAEISRMLFEGDIIEFGNCEYREPDQEEKD